MIATSAKLRLNLVIDPYKLHCLLHMTHMARAIKHHLNLTYSVAQKILLVAILLAPAASAQVSAVLSGTVSDQSGALVGAVTVTAKNLDLGTTRTTTTDSEGRYAIPSSQHREL